MADLNPAALECAAKAIHVNNPDWDFDAALEDATAAITAYLSHAPTPEWSPTDEELEMLDNAVAGTFWSDSIYGSYLVKAAKAFRASLPQPPPSQISDVIIKDTAGSGVQMSFGEIILEDCIVSPLCEGK